jgi:hypothetical protein
VGAAAQRQAEGNARYAGFSLPRRPLFSQY